MLTDERVAEIRARLAAATPGPWYADENPNPIYEWRVCQVRPDQQYCVVAAEISRTDVPLIAAAPADLADLLADRDALAAENRRLRAALTTLASDDSGAFRDSLGQRDPLRMRGFARLALEEK